jgi:hypothetical protein
MVNHHHLSTLSTTVLCALDAVPDSSRELLVVGIVLHLLNLILAHFQVYNFVALRITTVHVLVPILSYFEVADEPLMLSHV